MAHRKGSILVLVLFVMTVLSLTAVSFAYRAALKSRSAQQSAVMSKLRAHAASAVSIAMGRLGENENDFDHPAEPWHAHAEPAGENWLEEWTRDSGGQAPLFVTEYSVIDEEGKLSILHASSEALEKLGMSAEQIASLFDWMDTDDIARAEGAEDDYYLNRPKPHRCKNSPLELLDELLLVRGFHPADYGGEDVNHNRRLDPRENDGAVTYPLDDADGLLALGWVDLLTVRGDGRININTAPRAVLETLPLSDGAVGQIIGFRTFDADSVGSLEDHAFRSEQDIEQLQGLTSVDRDVLKQLTTFRSRHFRVFARARHLPTALRYHVEVLVRTGAGKPEILQWKSSI